MVKFIDSDHSFLGFRYTITPSWRLRRPSYFRKTSEKCRRVDYLNLLEFFVELEILFLGSSHQICCGWEISLDKLGFDWGMYIVYMYPTNIFACVRIYEKNAMAWYIQKQTKMLFILIVCHNNHIEFSLIVLRNSVFSSNHRQ